MKEQMVDYFYEEDACKEIREQIQNGWFVVSMCLHKIGMDHYVLVVFEREVK